MSSAVNLCCLHQFVFFFSLFFFFFFRHKVSVTKGASNTHHDGSMLRAPLFVQEFDQVSYQNLAKSLLAAGRLCMSKVFGHASILAHGAS